MTVYDNPQLILGESISDDPEVTIILPPDDVQEYADILRQRYNRQPIIAEDWPPRVGNDFFGRLTLIEGQNIIKRAEQQIHWYMLRGEVDKIPNLTGSKEIKIEDLLKTKDLTLLKKNKDVDLYSFQNIVIDGPPGIGKTTLCRKLLNMWSNGVLGCLFDLVLFCPLRNSKVAQAEKLEELFRYVYDCPDVPEIVKWVQKKHGKGLLIIFDGWDELSVQHRKSSLVANIICKNQLGKCSVIVTSRSYATASLLKVMPYVSKHVQIIGLSTKELSTVIIKTIQEDSDLAEKLINENAYRSNDHFKTTQYNQDSKLAVKLINELKVRGDVQSLCYIPLVCSMVILVYCKKGGQLPTTLTELYENFILQTIQRHIKKKHGTDPETLASLARLPSPLAIALKELSYLAYTTLADTKMTFSLYQLNLSVTEAAKEDYLGLLTKFEEFGEKKHQFIHLSIQEFLAAWWISKHDNTEKIFKDYFDNEHFKMCLRFVAGLTHLENKSYRQYFDKKKQLQCESSPLREFETSHHRWFHGLSQHARGLDFEELQVLLLQFLYESQNTTLCQLFANSMENQSLCLNRKAGISNSVITKLSLFEWLCFSYLLNSAEWNKLDLHELDEQSLSVLTAGLSNRSSVCQCQYLTVGPKNISDSNLLLNFFGKPLLHNIQSIIVVFDRNTCDLVPILLKLVTLSELKTLDFGGDLCTNFDETTYVRKCSELEQGIKKNSTLQNLIIRVITDTSSKKELLEPFMACILKGIAQNRVLRSLTIEVYKLRNTDADPISLALTEGILEILLRDNNTLQSLSLHMPNEFLPKSMNITVMSRLTALEIGESNSLLMNSLLPCIKGLKCLILPMSYPLCLIFKSHPNLQQLTIQLDTAESINELFTILHTNTRLRALRVEVEKGSVYTICSIGRHSYSYYKKCMSASSYMSIITAGIMDNTGLQQLSIPVYLPITNEQMKRFLNIISQTCITELKVVFQLDQTCSMGYKEKEIMKTFFYEQLLPDIFNMLRSHASIETMRIVCEYLGESSDINATAIEELFRRTPFPSLEQLEIKRTESECKIKLHTKTVVIYPYRYPITRKIKMYVH